MRIVEVFEAHGHRNVTATHPMTIELTRSPDLSTKGDCIVAVRSTKGANDLSEGFKRAASEEGAKITLTLEVAGMCFAVTGSGSPKLAFTDPEEMVFRKSSFTSERTVMVSADKASIDIPRKLVRILRNQNANVLVRLSVES